MEDEIYVGIDLGTSNSAVAYCENGRTIVMPLALRKKIIPSVIFFEDADKYIYGSAALKKGKMYPQSVFQHFKRMIGKQEKKKFEFSNVVPTEEIKKITYILDTNVFIDECYILDDVCVGENIIVPRTVIEELGERENDENTASSAERAKDEINGHLEQIIVEDSDVSLLPKDMFKNEDASNNNINDNKIISVALKYNTPETILVTSDKKIRQKVDILNKDGIANFSTMNLKEFSFRSQVNTDNVSNIELSGKEGAVLFLKNIKSMVEAKSGKKANKAVITVPQQFSIVQDSEIKDAGLEAGFEEIELRKEPIAAAVAYGLDLDSDKNILIYDFGGGTFDVSIIHQNGESFDVIDSDGNANLGGEDFTQELVEGFCYEILDEKHGISMFDETESGLSHAEFMENKMNIWVACEAIKCELSEQSETEKTVEIYVEPGKMKEITFSISRKGFDELVGRLKDESRRTLDNIIARNGLKRTDIDVVIMAGGTSTIPCVRQMVDEYFGKPSYSDRDPATLIAEGAAILADIKWNEDSTITKKPVIYEKTMSDFGVALKEHKFDCIIPADEDLPIRKSKIYYLSEDNQERLEVKLFNRHKGSNATRYPHNSLDCIGTVKISHLPPMLASEADVEVTFEITKEYTLNVSVVVMDKNGNEINRGASKIKKEGV